MIADFNLKVNTHLCTILPSHFEQAGKKWRGFRGGNFLPASHRVRFRPPQAAGNSSGQIPFFGFVN